MFCVLLIVDTVASTAISLGWSLTEGVDHPECLCVLHELLNIRIVMHSATLALATEEVFQGVLA